MLLIFILVDNLQFKKFFKIMKRVYIGNIPRSLDDRDLEKMLKKFGKVNEFNFKGSFAFAVSLLLLILKGI